MSGSRDRRHRAAGRAAPPRRPAPEHRAATPGDVLALLPDSVAAWLDSLDESERRRLLDLSAEWTLSALAGLGADSAPPPQQQAAATFVHALLLTFTFEERGGRL